MSCRSYVSRYDKSVICVSRQDSGVRVLEGNYCDKTGQIGAIGMVEYYGFTTIERIKKRNVKLCGMSLVFVKSCS